MCFRPSRSADRASGSLPRSAPPFDRGFGQPCLREVMREQLRFGCSGVGKLIAQNLRLALGVAATLVWQPGSARISRAPLIFVRGDDLRCRPVSESAHARIGKRRPRFLPAAALGEVGRECDTRPRLQERRLLPARIRNAACK